MTGPVVAIAGALAVGALALNTVAPTILPSPDELGKPEAEAEAKRLAHLEATHADTPFEARSLDGDDESESDPVYAGGFRSRKR